MTHLHKQRAAALITAATLTLALLFTGCPNAAGGGGNGGGGGTPTPTPTPPVPVSCSITFSVEGGHGTLKAKADGVPETEASPISVQKGKTVTFTANPDSGYKVKEWQIFGTGMVFEAGTGTAGNNTAQVNLQADLTVKVSFEALPPGEASYTVKHYQEGTDGTYPAEPTESENKSGISGDPVVYTPKIGGAYDGFTYKSNLTEINGTVQENGTIAADGSTVVKLYYERNTVNVTFKLAGGNIAGNTDPIVKTGKYGTAFTAPADLVKTDAVFKGWNPSLPSPLLYPASNAEYTAQWAPLYAITFGVDGANGTLKATVDGNEINTGDKVEQGTTVEFTAVPNAYYYVNQWAVSGGEFEAGTGIIGSTVAKVKITGNVTVSVSFKAETPLVEISSVIIPKAGTSYGGNKLPVKITGKNFKAHHVNQANFSGSGATFSNFNIVSDTFAMAEVECPSVVGDTTVTVTCKTASKTGVLSVKDYSTGYEVGKIVLADKSLVEKDSYTYTMVDHANPPVGVICGYTYGVPRMIALKKPFERLRWAEESTTGYSKKFEGIICNPSQTGDGAASTATFTGDIDGSDNWEYIKSIDPAGTADAATNYPAFNWVNEYNTTYASLLGGKSFAWYMPSIAELCEVYKNRIAINESYKKIRDVSSAYAPQELGSPYWSSSQYSNSSVYSAYAWYVFFTTGKLSSPQKNYYCSVCCLADFLNE